MKICPRCLKEHDRPLTFCSRSCANKRIHSKETRKKISNSIRKYQYFETKCLICNNKFITLEIVGRKTCSDKCAVELTAVKVRGSSHTVKDSSKMGGLRYNGGRNKLIEFRNLNGDLMLLNADEIEVAKILNNLKLNWQRNKNGFSYRDEQKKERKFYPDFYIVEKDLFIEYKGWVTPKMVHKMNDAIKRNNLKLKIIYSNDKRYKNLGLNLNDLKKNPKLLFE